MTTRTVITQAELDQALAEPVTTILINSPHGVWLTVRASGSATVRAYGSATVRAYDSATVRAYDSATVRAYDSATVRAYDSATVEAYGSATVRAYGSATVEAYGSATVRAYGSATVRAYGSATVRASGSATVRASGWATVRASGWATVRAYDSATVEAYDSATVRASKYVAIHLWSQRVTLSGGVLIDMTALDLADPQTWAEYHGATNGDGTGITVYKAVDGELNAGHHHKLTAYPLGETVTAPDWEPTARCGNGLHFSPSPHKARGYYNGSGEPRFLAVRVDLADIVCLDDKIKARSCQVLHEVTIDGKQVRP